MYYNRPSTQRRRQHQRQSPQAQAQDHRNPVGCHRIGTTTPTAAHAACSPEQSLACQECLLGMIASEWLPCTPEMCSPSTTVLLPVAQCASYGGLHTPSQMWWLCAQGTCTTASEQRAHRARPLPHSHEHILTGSCCAFWKVPLEIPFAMLCQLCLRCTHSRAHAHARTLTQATHTHNVAASRRF